MSLGVARRTAAALLSTFAFALGLAGAGCSAESAGDPAASASAGEVASPEAAGEVALRTEELALVASTDFRRPKPPDLGADPIAIAALPDGFVALLRGRDALVRLGFDRVERARVAVPMNATGVAVGKDGVVLVSIRGRARLAAYDASVPGALVARTSADVTLPGLASVAAIAADDRCVYAVDHELDRLSYECGRSSGSVAVAAGPHRLARTPGFVVVASLEGHALTAIGLDRSGVPSGAARVARIDGPFWGVAALESPEGSLLVAASGPEDAKLDRRDGSFAHVDSFVYLYRDAPGVDALERVAELDVSDDGVVVPKALAMSLDATELAVDVTAYGSGNAERVTWPLGELTTRTARREVYAAPPGIASVARSGAKLVGASTLLDAWVELEPRAVSSRPVELERPEPDRDRVRLGELLAMTTLMAPWQSSEGPLSRFTCETCHFEGGVDGRTHATGRADSTATTKPLWGLFNNAPHFTRALDEDTAGTVYAEFRVAGAKSGGPTWFALADAPAPWLPASWAADVDGSPEGLRRALLYYIRASAPPERGEAHDRARFDPTEADGARVFERRCESCHAARLVANDPASRVPPSEWETLVMSPDAPIVWARAGWEMTGVEPYVHPNGARPSSLRRVATRRPYFTSGSAASLDAVLAKVGVSGDRFFHDHAPPDATPLSDDERRALAAFLARL